MASDRYFIGPGLKDKLRDVIKRSESSPVSGDMPKIQTAHQELFRRPVKVKVAAYPRTIAWAHGLTQTVDIYTHDGIQYGLSGTATAINLCTDFSSNGPIGPTPTMTWCIVADGAGGILAAVEGPQKPKVHLAAYPRTSSWQKGQQQTVTLYTHDGSLFGPSEDGTAVATNFCNDFPSGGPEGPTPTMTWCVVATSPGGVVAAVEGPQQPKVHIAAYPRTAVWQKGQQQAVTLYTHDGSLFGPAEEGTAIATNFCNTFPAGGPEGPTPTMTWCVVATSRGGVIAAVEGPQSQRVHLAAYPRTSHWMRGQQQTVTLYTHDGTEYGVSEEGTAVATNFCNDFPSNGPEGPTPTMTWCVVATSPGGVVAAVEGPQQPKVQLAAYPRTSAWIKGQQQTVTLYTHDGTEYGPSGDGTAIATNFCNDFPADAAGGPTPTMTWCVVATSRGGALAAVEGPQSQPIRIATFTGSWSKNSDKTVTFKFQTATPNTVRASNLFANVEGSGTRNCAVAREGTAWYLIAAEC